jgi:hypothetical protein
MSCKLILFIFLFLLYNFKDLQCVY